MRVLKFMAAVCLTAATASAAISTSEVKRLNTATEVVKAMHTSEEAIPDKYWTRAECIVVIPGLKKAAFGLGGEFGRGVMSCKDGTRWSAPLFMALEKGSWGFQIGATEIDLVLLVMNREGADKLLSNKVSLGADASVAAGPVGRRAEAGTDLQMRAEILSYSRARGVFAGVNISGGTLRPDKDANADAYGANVEPKSIVFGSVAAPAEARPFVSAIGDEVSGTAGVK